MIGNQATNKAVARTLAAFGLFTDLEIGNLLAGTEHELLLGLDLLGQLRHLLQQTPQVARQRVLGQQFGEVLGGLLQPVGGGAQAGVMGKMANGLVWQVMAFVEHIDRVTGVGQYRSAAQGKVSQDHVVVGDDHIDLAHAFAGLVEGALAKVGAMAVGALAVIGGQARPVLILKGLGPTVAVAVPLIAGQLFDHAGKQLLAGFIDFDLEAFFLEQLRRRGLRVALLQQHVEFGQAHVAPAPLGQGKAEVQPAVAHQVREVLVDDLLLQGDRCRGNHQALARGLGHRNGGQAVSHGLAGASTRFYSDHSRVATAVVFFVGVDIAQHLGHFSDHQTLTVTGLEALGFEKTRVCALDLGFEFGTNHGSSGARNAG